MIYARLILDNIYQILVKLVASLNGTLLDRQVINSRVNIKLKMTCQIGGSILGLFAAIHAVLDGSRIHVINLVVVVEQEIHRISTPITSVQNLERDIR